MNLENLRIKAEACCSLMIVALLVLPSIGLAQTSAADETSGPRWAVRHQYPVLVADLPLAKIPDSEFNSGSGFGDPLLIIVDLSPDAGMTSDEAGHEEDPFRQDFEPDPFETENSTDQPSEADNDVPFEKDPFEKEQEPIPPMSDPWEGFNRTMYTFNDNLYVYVMKPVAETWRGILNEEFRIAISNLFDNALAPAKLFSCLFQGQWEKSGRVVGRTVLNTVFGFGGMLDVAGQEYGIENVNEDFGQALGYHRFKSGPYIVLPFLGPSSVRHTFGRVVDSFLNPTFFFSPGFFESTGITAGNMINETSFRIEDFDTLKKDALDPYESMRDFYHQYREQQIRK